MFHFISFLRIDRIEYVEIYMIYILAGNDQKKREYFEIDIDKFMFL